MISKNCPWWIRWYHRRLRRADEKFLYPVLAQRGRESGKTATAWAIHRAQEWHWCCPCAQIERKFGS